MSAYKFQFYCGMTCYGGSEQKECPCTGPAKCELKDDPNYEQARDAAKGRMMNLLRGALTPDDKKPSAN